jgi:hypothetical protein
MSSGLPLNADIAQRSRHVLKVPISEVAYSPTALPSSLPVELLMKCSLVQAGQAKALWVSTWSSGASSSQCCTFRPV